MPCQARFNPRVVTPKTGAAFRRRTLNVKNYYNPPHPRDFVLPYLRFRLFWGLILWDIETVVKGGAQEDLSLESLALYTLRAFQP